MKNNIRKFAGIMILALAAIGMTACGNKNENSQGQKESPVSSSELPVDASKENIDYAETTVVTETVVTTAPEETTTAEETATTEPSEAPQGGGNSGSGGSGEQGSPIQFDAKSSNLTDDTALHSFTVFGGRQDLRDNYNISAGNNTWKDYDSLVNELNRRDNFLMIDGEQYSGGLADVLGFNGQTYWLRGEGNSKMYIEKNDAGEITAIAFSDLKTDYELVISTTVVQLTDKSTSLSDFTQRTCSASNPPAQYDCDNGYLTFVGDGIWCVIFEVDTTFSDPAHDNDEYIRGIMMCRRDRLNGYINN